MKTLTVPAVLISVPNTGWIHKFVAMALSRIQVDNKGYKLTIILPTHIPYENNLHHIVCQFIKEKHDFWLSIDADNPPTKNPLDLIALDLDIVGLPTPVWHYTGKKKERPMYLNAYDYVSYEDAYKEHSPHEGLQQVDAIGTGCFLLAKRVFDHPKMRKAPFQRQYHEDGRVNKGNDISFCERARKNDFKIWTHYDYMCQHFNELEILEVRKACVSEFMVKV